MRNDKREPIASIDVELSIVTKNDETRATRAYSYDGGREYDHIEYISFLGGSRVMICHLSSMKGYSHYAGFIKYAL
jgi:hypothetical protein